MVERKEVEALLAYIEQYGLTPTVSMDTLAALCRAWLAVQDAPVAALLPDTMLFRGAAIVPQNSAHIAADMGQVLPIGQRVRIVKEGE